MSRRTFIEIKYVVVGLLDLLHELSPQRERCVLSPFSNHKIESHD